MSTLSRGKVAHVVFLALFMVLSSPAVQLAWEPSPDSTVTGYKIYYGGSSRNYTNSFNVGNQTNGVVFVDRGVYYFAVTAYNRFGLESDYSNEIRYNNTTSRIIVVRVATSTSTGGPWTVLIPVYITNDLIEQLRLFKLDISQTNY